MTHQIQLQIDSSVRERWSDGAILALCFANGCDNDRPLGSDFDAECETVVSQLREIGKTVFDESRIQRMRKTFRTMPRMDPTRYRPASEGLIRRCLDKGLFRICPLVDVNNLLSVRLRIPLGIYDLERVSSTAWSYRLGHTDEEYTTFAKQVKSAHGKLVLADENGVIGSPVSDSARAAIGKDTTDILVVAYLPVQTAVEEAQRIAASIAVSFSDNFSLSSEPTTVTVD